MPENIRSRRRLHDWFFRTYINTALETSSLFFWEPGLRLLREWVENRQCTLHKQKTSRVCKVIWLLFRPTFFPLFFKKNLSFIEFFNHQKVYISQSNTSDNVRKIKWATKTMTKTRREREEGEGSNQVR